MIQSAFPRDVRNQLLADSGLVMVPWGHVLGNTNITLDDKVFGNQDGSGTGLAVSTVLRQWRGRLRGRRFGLRWSMYYAIAVGSDFTVGVDGIHYTVPWGWLDYKTNAAVLNTSVAMENSWVCPDVFDEGTHDVELWALAGSGQWWMHGWLLEREAGYKDPIRAGNIRTNVAIPNGSYGSLLAAATPFTIDIPERYCTGVIIRNPTSGAISGYVSIDGTDNGIIWEKSVAAYTTEIVSFPSPIAIGVGVNSRLRAKAGGAGLIGSVILLNA